MDEVIFLEVLEGDGVQARHRLERFPVSVGRGYDNDIILDDPKVSASHLRVERREDGALVVRDLGSQNGTFRVDPWAPLAEVVLTPDARVALGDTVLRFRPRSHKVEDTVIARMAESPRERLFEQPRAFTATLLVLVFACLVSGYVTNYQRTDWGDLLTSGLIPLGVALLWAGGWSLASRISRRSFQFRTHATLGGLMLLGVTLVPAATATLGFSLSWHWGLGFLTKVAYLGLLVWGLFWHLRYVTRWEPVRLLRVLVVGSGVFLLLTYIPTLLANEEFSPELDFSRSMLPPSFRVARTQSLDAFFQDSAQLQKDVDSLAKEE
ncbi:FHA domain-containing protein [Corallococcus sp. M34]|uniref:FHA domain-containing protein n=1 Tax=Citreicoccus inhibens TaxID=2849499 RepID=UPI001C2424E3|nr:FHA domain-containing protein [Citreicoccus inhibens]MBU8894564.1 FHA domain-containing protein [Citreicoccus inhibens]